MQRGWRKNFSEDVFWSAQASRSVSHVVQLIFLQFGKIRMSQDSCLVTSRLCDLRVRFQRQVLGASSPMYLGEGVTCAASHSRRFPDDKMD